MFSLFLTSLNQSTLLTPVLCPISALHQLSLVDCFKDFPDRSFSMISPCLSSILLVVCIFNENNIILLPCFQIFWFATREYILGKQGGSRWVLSCTGGTITPASKWLDNTDNSKLSPGDITHLQSILVKPLVLYQLNSESHMKYTSSLLSSLLTENDGKKLSYEELHLLDKFLTLTFSGSY